ncbi:putative deacylase [Natronocella acetinitrilica]|uniref:Deacylase n=1 Tax=Natronocella acetinitrilica TaxID=414046 RepID=A0AAE3KHZ7_9GAMM|nr:succinylglutamate desuccinylase/aspartoacylase family protein [Natronocella acetinitrilica]MCP1676852.1 putative deacylase [Natronocella acetinitrilica]
MSRQPFEIAGVRVRPGTRQTLDLPAGHLYTHTPLTIPLQVIHGRRAGPCLVVSAAVHGDEINGVEIIRRLLRHKTLDRLAGTLVAVPIVNVLGFTGRSRYLPDRRDLNRSFPGSEAGSMASRLAHLFRTQVLAHASHVIDLHTAAIHRDNLPQIRADLDHPGDEALARATGLPVLIHSPLIDGSLRRAARELGVPVVTYEAGEALRFDEAAIRAGVRGILRAMRELDMLAAPRGRRQTEPTPLVADASLWVRAPQDGILRAAVALGAHVAAGQPMGWVADPFGERETAVESPVAGVVIGRTNLPLVHQGEALFHVARFQRGRRAALQLERFSETLDQIDDDWAEPPIV